MNILQIIRNIIYRQETLEKNGWEMLPSQQRRLESVLDNLFAFMFATSIGLLGWAFLINMAELHFNPLLEFLRNCFFAVGSILLFFSITYSIIKRN